MKLRRLLALLAALALVFTLVACNEKRGIPEPDYDNLPDDYEEDYEDESEPVASEPASSTPTPAYDPAGSHGTASAPAATGKSEAICALAEQLIVTTFRYGAAGPTEFDNSGFVYYCCHQNGVDLPRKTAEMATFGTAVGKDELKRGDVLI
ncbi:MAG: C40 family peptidase, partial [Clostridia bacterium]|nr:C40 family peptidase [Clostridia bacterium]